MADQKFIQGQIYTLYGAGIVTTDTSITVAASFATPDGTLITTSDLGPQNWGTLAPNTSNEEAFSFTGVTQNGDGTATLTGVVRGLLFVSPYTTSAALKQNHQGGTELILSNNPGMYDDFASESTDETITGAWTFTQFPVKSGSTTPTAAGELSPKAYVDLVGTGTANYDQNLVAAVAGATVAAGEVVYLKETDGEWYLADASTSSTCENLILGIAQGAGTDGNSIAGGVLIAGIDKNATYTAGAKYYATDVAGALGTSAGTVEVLIGTGDANNNLILEHVPTNETVTADEKDALVGNNGTPATGNKYVTQTGLQLQGENYATSTTGNDTYVVTLSPVPAAYVAGMVVRFKPDTANTEAATLNVNGLGAKNITKNGTETLATSDIRANHVVTVVYDGTQFQLNNRAAQVVKFGGDGSDGVLNVTSGTTNIDASSANYVVKNYSSINVSAGATLGLTNAASDGTVLILKCSGNVTIAGTIDLNGKGADGGPSGGVSAIGAVGTTAIDILDTSSHTGGVASFKSKASGGLQFDDNLFFYPTADADRLYRRFLQLAPGSGGSSGTGNQNGDGTGGKGGDGGGALLIECAGSWNFTGTIDISGEDGDDGSAGTNNGGGGGGGGCAGMLIALYNSLTANSGTVDASGGAGGDAVGGTSTGNQSGGGGGGGGGSYSDDGGDGGDGGNDGNNGNNGSNSTTASGGGGGGGEGGGPGTTGGTGGTANTSDTNHYVIAENLWFT